MINVTPLPAVMDASLVSIVTNVMTCAVFAEPVID
jgi:hypothetical protein